MVAGRFVPIPDSRDRAGAKNTCPGRVVLQADQFDHARRQSGPINLTYLFVSNLICRRTCVSHHKCYIFRARKKEVDRRALKS